MNDTLITLYPWLKAFHIIAVISWMAALFYLPRLFVYHVQTQPGSEMSNQFLVMEERLIRIIMTPAMILTFSFGVLLLFVPGLISWHDGWLHIKLTLVLMLAAAHGLGVKYYKNFVQEKRNVKQVYFRIANEVPVVIMILIVIMVVVRPF